MAPALLHLAVLSSGFVPVPEVQPSSPYADAAAYYVQAPQPPAYYVASPQTQFLGRTGPVVMSTQYGDPAVRAYKKKDPATGSTKGLFGYTVGSRAPSRAVNSGTIQQFGYGVDNLYGGKAKVTKSAGLPAAGTSNALLGGAGYAANKTGLDPTGLGPLFCWIGLIILVGSYFKFA